MPIKVATFYVRIALPRSVDIPCLRSEDTTGRSKLEYTIYEPDNCSNGHEWARELKHKLEDNGFTCVMGVI